MEPQLLTLVRHAKSSWQIAGQSDHDRPLNERGLRDAPDMARRLLKRGCVPDQILCSSATRTRQTADILASAFQLTDGQMIVLSDLYLASPEKILQVYVAHAGSARHSMIIGHNPGLEDLSAMLSEDTDGPMPTMAVRHFRHPVLSAPTSLRMELVFQDHPKNVAADW